MEQPTVKGSPGLEPSYWLSYEYNQMFDQMKSLDEKMNIILSIIQKKPRKNTMTEVNTKVDSILQKLIENDMTDENLTVKKRKIENEMTDENMSVKKEDQWTKLIEDIPIWYGTFY